MIRLIKESNNLHQVVLPDLVIWFSYETPIAYMQNIRDGRGKLHPDTFNLHITKNIWSSTTGKHLNMIDPDKSKRIDNHEFNELLQKAVTLQ